MFKSFISLCFVFSMAYGVDLANFKHKTSPLQINVEQLLKCDEIVKDLFDNAKLEDGDVNRFFAYFCNANLGFAETSKKLTGSYSGTLTAINEKIIPLFLPNTKFKDPATDPFSIELADYIAKPFQERYKQEQANIHPVKVPEGKQYWQGDKPYYGQKIPTMQPWSLKSANQYRLKPLPPEGSDFWKEQLTQLKQYMAEATKTQKDKIFAWADTQMFGPSDWKLYSERYMNTHDVPLAKRIEVRSKLATAMQDAMIAAFDSKYALMIKRPIMMDPTLKILIKTPNHPSYPSAHSTVGEAAATVLSHYFPENETEWKRLVEEAGMSRIWAGIHFPIDHQAGKELGAKVGKAALEQG